MKIRSCICCGQWLGDFVRMDCLESKTCTSTLTIVPWSFTGTGIPKSTFRCICLFVWSGTNFSKIWQVSSTWRKLMEKTFVPILTVFEEFVHCSFHSYRHTFRRFGGMKLIASRGGEFHQLINSERRILWVKLAESGSDLEWMNLTSIKICPKNRWRYGFAWLTEVHSPWKYDHTKSSGSRINAGRINCEEIFLQKD